MKMPFGKHKGKEIEDIPKQYLYWLNSQEWVREELRNACSDYLGDWKPTRRKTKNYYNPFNPVDMALYDIAEKHGVYDYSYDPEFDDIYDPCYF